MTTTMAMTTGVLVIMIIVTRITIVVRMMMAMAHASDDRLQLLSSLWLSLLYRKSYIMVVVMITICVDHDHADS